MSNGTKVKKRDGRIESLDLDKMHLMVEDACKTSTRLFNHQMHLV